MDETKYVLSKEVAESEIKKIFDYYELDVNEIEDEKAKNMIKNSYSRLVKAARLGRLEVKTDNGFTIIQHLRDSNEIITYKEISGTAKTEMAGKKEDDLYGKIYALQGSVSGLGEGAMRLLKGVDCSLCEVLGAIFLSV